MSMISSPSYISKTSANDFSALFDPFRKFDIATKQIYFKDCCTRPCHRRFFKTTRRRTPPSPPPPHHHHHLDLILSWKHHFFYFYASFDQTRQLLEKTHGLIWQLISRINIFINILRGFVTSSRGITLTLTKIMAPPFEKLAKSLSFASSPRARLFWPCIRFCLGHWELTVI